jgi:hypothetical protein
MKKVTIFIAAALALIFMGYSEIRQSRHEQRLKTAISEEVSENGFSRLPYNIFPDGIIILAAMNCTKEQARKADSLAAELKRRGVPHRRTNTIDSVIEIKGEDDKEKRKQKRDRLGFLINQPPPLVVVNNKVRSNPDLEAILAEYQRDLSSI